MEYVALTIGGRFLQVATVGDETRLRADGVALGRRSCFERVDLGHDRVALRPFSVRDILRTPFRNDQVQNLYFVLPDMQALWDSMDELETVLQEELVSVV